MVGRFYRMGEDDEVIRNGKVDDSFMKAQKCQQVIGVSVDEELPSEKYMKGKGVYLFDPKAWNQTSLEGEIDRLG